MEAQQQQQQIREPIQVSDTAQSSSLISPPTNMDQTDVISKQTSATVTRMIGLLEQISDSVAKLHRNEMQVRAELSKLDSEINETKKPAELALKKLEAFEQLNSIVL